MSGHRAILTGSVFFRQLNPGFLRHEETKAQRRTKVFLPFFGPLGDLVSLWPFLRGENMQVYWTVPGSSRELIPDSAFGDLIPPTTCGLNYKYYEAVFYPISITYFEKDGVEAMKLYWTGPGIQRQLIPATSFCSVPPALTQLNNINQQALINGKEALIKPAKELIAIKLVYPNPFTESFRIDFYNTSLSKVSVDVLD